MTPEQSTTAHSATRDLSPLLARRWATLVFVRLVVAVALLAVAAGDTRLGPDTDLLNAALLTSVLPWHLLLAFIVLRRSSVPWYLSFADATVVAAAASLVSPDIWPVTVLAAPAIIAVEVHLGGRVWATACAAFTVGVFAASGVLAEATYLPATVAALVLGAAVIVTVVGTGVEERATTIAHQRSMLSDVPALIWEVRDGDAMVVRGQLRTVLGYTEAEWDELAGVGSLLHPDDLGVFQPAATMALRDGAVLVREFRLRRRDGRWLWLRDTVRAETEADGTVTLRGVSTDVTSEKSAEQSIGQVGALLGRLATPLHIVRVDRERLVLERANTPHRIDLTDPELIAACRSATSSGQQVISLDRGFEMWPLDRDRVAVLFADADEHGATGSASRDTLTDLPDRGALRARLESILRADPATTLALLVLDLDQFKEVNDTLGHGKGDELLQVVAERIEQVAMPTDLVCRLGGDEFALLLVDDGPERAPLVAADLETTIAHPIVLDGVHIQAGVSIGAALAPDDGQDADLLLQRADVAMYQAKSAGETYRRYDPSDDRFTVRRLKLLGELPRALRESELVVHYQPKIDLRAATVVGVEALVRWNHPEHGMVPPDEFIELAEVSGLVRELTRQVIRDSVAQLRAWDDEGVHLSVAVNLSVRNFTDPDLAVWVERCLDENDVDPARLMLEITESEVMEDVVLALGVLERLSALGVRSSIDDFGTGYSSLSYLRQLPIDEIKIDRSFVGTMAVNQGDIVIVRSIIELGHNLDLDVVAEGVEDEWTLDSLRALGCDQAQGYYFSRPVPAEEIARFVETFTDTRIALL